MTEEQIMKALEYHRTTMENHCNECPYKGRLSSIALPSDTLDLINRQKAEIEKLNVELVGMRGACESYKIHYDNAQAEIERLQALVDEMSDYFPSCIVCEGKTTLGERTDECVYLIGNTEYCAKKGIENIGRIMRENRELKEMKEQ